MFFESIHYWLGFCLIEIDKGMGSNKLFRRFSQCEYGNTDSNNFFCLVELLSLLSLFCDKDFFWKYYGYRSHLFLNPIISQSYVLSSFRVHSFCSSLCFHEKNKIMIIQKLISYMYMTFDISYTDISHILRIWYMLIFLYHWQPNIALSCSDLTYQPSTGL